MKRTELCEILKADYRKGMKAGVLKIDLPNYTNIYFVIPPSPPKNDIKDLPYEHLSKATRVLATLPFYQEMSDMDKLINHLFVRREAVQSSRLEGTWSTIDHALTPGEIANNEDGQGEHQSVRSYASSLEKILDKAYTKGESIFTIDLICQLHKNIVKNDPNTYGIPGKLRTPNQPGSIVTIGGGIRMENSIYNPTPPSEVKRCLEEVIEWHADKTMAQLADAGHGLTLPVRLAIGHSHFEAVHPFSDGNGRAGRALWPIQMACAGHTPLYLSGYVEAHKNEYIRALESAQKKLKYRLMIEFVCEAIIESYLEAKKTKKTIENLPADWRLRGDFRAKSAAERALDLLPKMPIITSEILARELKISGPAAHRALKQLVEKKIIKKRYKENRSVIYAAEELIQILSRKFGTDIDLALEQAKIYLQET